VNWTRPRPSRATRVSAVLAFHPDLVMQIHYDPSGKPEMDQSSVGLTFTEKPTKGLSGLLTGTRRIDILAGEAHYEVRDSLVIPQDVDLIGITPHAHYLCKEMKVDARLPDGSVTPLIWIKDWDFLTILRARRAA
jgi:hypothetical protein